MSNPPLKNDDGKIDLRYVPTQAVTAVAEVQAYARYKYREAYEKHPNNHKLVEPERWHKALLRHVEGMREDYMATDKESGIMHLKHILCTAAYLLQKIEEE